MATRKPKPRGSRGPMGKAGETGKTGPRGPSMRRSEVLAIVADQFRDIRKKMDLQLTRTAQIQAQLDHLARLITRIVNEDVSDRRAAVTFTTPDRSP